MNVTLRVANAFVTAAYWAAVGIVATIATHEWLFDLGSDPYGAIFSEMLSPSLLLYVLGFAWGLCRTPSGPTFLPTAYLAALALFYMSGALMGDLLLPPVVAFGAVLALITILAAHHVRRHFLEIEFAARRRAAGLDY